MLLTKNFKAFDFSWVKNKNILNMNVNIEGFFFTKCCIISEKLGNRHP